MLAVAFLSGKTQQHYTELFNALLREMACAKGNNQHRIAKIILDFEIALINAIRIVLPIVELGGCYFHFVQSLWRNVQRMGLAAAYKDRNDRRMKICLNHLFALGFVPI